MQDTVTRYLQNLRDQLNRAALVPVINGMADRFSTQSLTSAGLVIKAGGSAIVKGGSAYYGVAQGILVNKTANTDMAALSGTVTNATFNIFCFYVDSAGTLTSQMGTAGSTLAAVKFPVLPVGKAQIGFVVINPTGTGDFVGGTTALDDATVVPTAAYINTIGPFDPSILL